MERIAGIPHARFTVLAAAAKNKKAGSTEKVALKQVTIRIKQAVKSIEGLIHIRPLGDPLPGAEPAVDPIVDGGIRLEVVAWEPPPLQLTCNLLGRLEKAYGM